MVSSCIYSFRYISLTGEVPLWHGESLAIEIEPIYPMHRSTLKFSTIRRSRRACYRRVSSPFLIV